MRKVIAVLCVVASAALLCGASGCTSAYSDGPPPTRGSSSKLGGTYGMSAPPASAEVAGSDAAGTPSE